MDNWVIRETIDFSKPPVGWLETAPFVLMVPGDENAHTWEITCKKDGQAADLSGAAVDIYFIRKDGAIAPAEGTITGNVCSAVIPKAAYAYRGGVRGIFRLNSANGTVTLSDRMFYVQPEMGDGNVVGDDDLLPDLNDLLAQLGQLKIMTGALMAALASGVHSVYVEDETLYIERADYGTTDAYELAVKNGYTGTRAQWDEAIAVITGDAEIIASIRQTANEAKQIAQAAVTHENVSITLLSSGWTESEGLLVQTVACSIVTPGNDLIVGPGSAMTAEQYTAMVNAQLVCTGQASGQLTFTAYGVEPQENIPVNVIAFG